MAKRELIAKEDAIAICLKSWDESDAAQNIKDEQAITEQEIVKPYLEKLKADIEVAYDELDGYDPDSLGAFASRIDDLIDNLLSESEGKE